MRELEPHLHPPAAWSPARALPLPKSSSKLTTQETLSKAVIIQVRDEEGHALDQETEIIWSSVMRLFLVLITLMAVFALVHSAAISLKSPLGLLMDAAPTSKTMTLRRLGMSNVW